MHSPIATPSCSSASSPGGWRGRAQVRTSRLCGCHSPARLRPSHAVAGVGVQVPANGNSPNSPTGRGGSPSTSFSGRSSSPSPRPTNAPLQILVRAAKQARVVTAAPAELSEVSSRLAAAQSWPALQMLALQYQGRLDHQTVVAVLRRAAQLAKDTRTAPSSAEQYACARFLESVAMSCAALVPTMGPPTVAAVLGILGALAEAGLVPQRSTPQVVGLLVQALVLTSMPQLHHYNGSQLAYVLRGGALLSPGGLPEVWLDEWQAVTSCEVLGEMPPDALEAVMDSLQALYGTQNWMPADRWLGELLQAVERKLGAYDGEGLRQLAVALAGLELRPNSGWFGNFRRAFDRRVAASEVAPQDVAGVLYALTKLEVAYA